MQDDISFELFISFTFFFFNDISTFVGFFNAQTILMDEK